MGEYNLRRLTIDEATEMLEDLQKIRPLGKEYNKTADALRHHFGQDDGYDRGVYVVEKDGALLLWATSLETEEYVVIGSMGTKDPQAFTPLLDYLTESFPKKLLEIACPETQKLAIRELEKRQFAETMTYLDSVIYLREPPSLAPWTQQALESSSKEHREESLLRRLEFATGVRWKIEEVVAEAGDDLLSAIIEAFPVAPEDRKYVLVADIAPLSTEKETELRKGLEEKFGFTNSSYKCHEGGAQIIIPVDDEAVKKALQVEITRGECAKHFSAPKRIPRLQDRRLETRDVDQVLSLVCITQENAFYSRTCAMDEALLMTRFPNLDYNELTDAFTLVMHDEDGNVAICAKCEKVSVGKMLKLNHISVADVDDFVGPLRQLFAVLQSEFKGHTLRFKLDQPFVDTLTDAFPEIRTSMAGCTIRASQREQGGGRE